MSRLLLALPFALLLPLFAPAAGESEEDRLAAFFKAYLAGELAEHPLAATRLGNHEYDHLLDDLSPKARAGWAKRYKETLAELPKRVDPKKLSRSAQIDYEILAHRLEADLWLLENGLPPGEQYGLSFEEDPLLYNQYLTDSVYLLLTQSTLPKKKNLENAAARIALLPRVIDAARASLRNPPKVYVETAIARNKGAIAFYEGGIYELAGENPSTSDLKPACARVLPALKEYQTFLEKKLLPKATGEWRLGKKKFAKKLSYELNAGLSADEVLKAAEEEFTRVEREMYVIARQLWSKHFPKEALPPDDAAGRRRTITAVLAEVGKDHGKASELVKDAKACVEKIKAFITKHDVLRLPDPDRCKIVEMPEFRRGFSLAYLDPAPPLDPKATSYYAISPPPSSWDARKATSLLEEYNRHMLHVLSIHEGYPGHYVQLEYGNRHPSPVRRVLQSGVFAEGWAVYTEQMMLDQGYGDGDLALRLSQLKFYLRAVCNAIIDHKMHCSEMTDKEAVALMVERAFQTEGEAQGKVIRAKLSSCQLSTYFVGRMAFYNLRQKVQREQAEKFSLGRYHEAVLDHGTLPVKYLPELTRERLKKPR
jgi:uncharacterized protein (DUF885 family)